MRKIHKILLTGVLAFSFGATAVLTLASTNKPIQAVYAELPSLQNVSVDSDGVLSWDAFEGASDYYFLFGTGGGYTDGATSIDLETTAKSYHLESGDIYWSVCAVDDEGNQISATSEGTYAFTNTQTPLDTPTNLTWNHTVASWDSVENADYYAISLFEYVDGEHDSYISGASGLVFSETSKDFGTVFEVNKQYYFEVCAQASYDDLDHKDSDYETSGYQSFAPVVASLEGHVSITNGLLNFNDVEGLYEVDYEFRLSGTTTSKGGGTTSNLPIDLYYDAAINGLDDSEDYDIKINAYNEYKEPLAPEYLYEGWHYDSSEAPVVLTGTVTINGTLKVGQTLSALVTDSNNTGTLTYFWYRSDSYEGWVSVQTGYSSTFTITEVCANKKLYVVVHSSNEIGQISSDETSLIAEADAYEALTGTVSINGSLKYGETLTANVTSNNTGTLAYQWRRNNVAISGATSQTYALVEADIGTQLSVRVTSDHETGYIQSEQTVAIAKADGPAAPTGLTATACTTSDNNDGTISGVTALMEYKLSSDTEWTNGTGETLTGLANGTYNVRVKETTTHNAGEIANVVVNGYDAPTQYSITVNNGTANAVSSVEGETITVTANGPAAGYVFAGWTSDDVTFADASSASTTFVMPAKNVTVTATYEEVTPDPVTLSSITLSGTMKTTFEVGDAFTYDGLVVTAHYSDDSSHTVTGYTVSSPDMSTAGNKTVTVTYTENEITKTSTYQITVNEKSVTPPVDSETPSTNSGLPAGAIVGIVIGSVLVAGIGGFALVWFVIKKKTWADFVALFKKK